MMCLKNKMLGNAAFITCTSVLALSLVACQLFKSDQEKAQEAFNKGLKAISANKTDEAFIHFRNAVQLQPDFPKSHYRLGILYVKKGQPRMAVRELQTALDQEPDFPAATRYLALLLYRNGAYDQAIPHLEKLVSSTTPNVEDFLALADSLFKTEKYEQASSVLQKALSVFPDNMDLKMLMARSLFANNDKPEAIELLKTVISDHPDKMTPRLVLINYHEQKGQEAQAEKALQDLRQDFPEQAVSYVVSARHALKRKDLDQAKNYLDQGLNNGVTDSEIYRLLGLIAHYKKHSSEAIKWLKKAVSVDSDNRKNYMLLADYYIFLKEFAKAREIYEQMIDRWPKLKPVKTQLAKLLLAERKDAQAKRHINELLEQDPDFAYGHVLKGLLEQKKGNKTEARQAFLRARELAPDKSEGHFFYGLSLLEDKQYKLSLSEILAALEKNPDSVQIRLALAFLYFRTDKLQQALQELETVLSKSSKDPKALSMKAAVLKEMGRFNKAEDVYRLLLQEKGVSKEAVRFQIAETLTLQEKYSKAMAIYRDLLEKGWQSRSVIIKIVGLYLDQKEYDQGIEFIDRQLRDPVIKRSDLYFLKAFVALEGKKYRLSKETLKMLHQEDPDSVPVLFLLGKIYFQDNQLGQAVNATEQALSIQPGHLGASRFLARIYIKQKKWDKAIGVYEGILDKHPDNGSAINDLAYLYAKEDKNLDKAYELAQRAKTIMPDNPEVNDTLGWIAFKKGALGMAASSLCSAVKEKPDQPVFRYHLGNILFERQAFDQARQELQKSIELGLDSQNQKKAHSLLEKIQLQTDFKQEILRALDQGKFDMALKKAKKAKELRPDDSEIIFYLGRTYFEKGSTLMALRYLREAVELSPETSRYHYYFGQALLHDGQEDEAKVQLQRSLETGLDKEYVPKAQELLAKIEKSQEL